MIADAGAYRALVRRRWFSFLTAALVCFGLAAVIELIEYRLLIIAIVVAFPAVIPLIELVFVRRWARQMGAAVVRLEGKTLTLKPGLSLDVGALTFVRVQPDALVLNEKFGPGVKDVRVHLVPAEGELSRAFTDRLQALGVKVVVEKGTLMTVALAVWGLLAQHGLDKLAGLLVLGALGFGGKALVDDEPVGWEAAACFVGALVALGLRALILHFLPPEAKAGLAEGSKSRNA